MADAQVLSMKVNHVVKGVPYDGVIKMTGIGGSLPSKAEPRKTCLWVVGVQVVNSAYLLAALCAPPLSWSNGHAVVITSALGARGR